MNYTSSNIKTTTMPLAPQIGRVFVASGALLAWSLFLFIKHFIYGSEAAVSFNG